MGKPNSKEFMNMGQTEKRKKIKELRIVHPRFVHALDLIKVCHESTKISNDPKCMLISGESGAGKSTIFETYLQFNDHIKHTETGTKKVILSAEIPSPITIISFLETLLEELGDPFPTKGTKTNKRHRLVNLIQDCGVELIMLDEFQHMVHPHNNRINHDVADCFKSLVNKTKVPVVLFGYEKDSNKVLNFNKQLCRRFSIRCPIPPFGYDNVKKKKEFRILLNEIDKTLPFEEMSNLADSDMADNFYEATGGLMDFIMKIIRDAASFAIIENKKKIELEDFEKAFKLHTYLFDRIKFNPFENKKISLKPEEIIS